MGQQGHRVPRERMVQMVLTELQALKALPERMVQMVLQALKAPQERMVQMVLTEPPAQLEQMGLQVQPGLKVPQEQ